MTTAEFGTWKSPISSRLATTSAVTFQELHRDGDPAHPGVIYWTEMRSEEEGRYVVCSKTIGQSESTQWTPREYSARTTVHEYGGGACLAHGGLVYFSNFDDQGLYVQSSPTDSPMPVTPGGQGWRYADPHFCQPLKRIYSVREDHGIVERGERKQPENSIVVVDPATQAQSVIASGLDFYSNPRVSPDGKRVVWLQWNHPNMPWDSTELWMADLSESGDAIVEGSPHKVAGEGGVSIIEPSWTPDNQLLYISDQTDWWNLYHVTKSGDHINLHPANQELGGPQWEFACYSYDVDPNGSGKIATTFAGELGVLDINTHDYKAYSTGFTKHDHVQFTPDGHIYCVASSPVQFSAVIRVHAGTGKTDIVKASRSLPVDVGYLSVPKEITWPTGTDNKEVSHGFFYPPQNKDYVGLADTAPPLLVRVHGGPTGQSSNALRLEIQYFTSRGFVILDVNYRGSTGYGKAYRHRQRGNWGIVDVEDCCSGALYLANTNQVDRKRLCIDGGSAGGYTTLACLAFKDVFTAGASHYGVADVAILMQDTHKFESRYLDNLIAPYTEANLPLINARSPIKHIDSFNCPIVLFQGDEDKIVPPNQAELMFESVKAKGIPCAFVLFEGEQHGFRKSENIQQALDGEFYFYARVFGFEPADKHCKLDISNL